MYKVDECPAEYLGDGVYAIHHGYGIELRTDSHQEPTNAIFLEDSVLSALNSFNEIVKETMI